MGDWRVVSEDSSASRSLVRVGVCTCSTSNMRGEGGKEKEEGGEKREKRGEGEEKRGRREERVSFFLQLYCVQRKEAWEKPSCK